VNTPAVFGNYVDIYDIAQAVEDGATVRIYYESRLAKVSLSEEGKRADRRTGRRAGARRTDRDAEGQGQVDPDGSADRQRAAHQEHCPRHRRRTLRQRQEVFAARRWW
jgi:type I site-specific restriction endonuclease